jgi:hypothetical protein
MFFRGFVNSFNVSRINTSLGIFRVSGFWCNENLEALKMNIDSIEIMGTDGWALLNQSNDNIIKLIKELTPILLAHLQTSS